MKTQTISEFYCYRYKGVKRIDEIEKGATSFAWKCRKYQNWTQVHNREDDKAVLLRFAQELLDTGRVIEADYGQICSIFLNVQRWRKDKEDLAVNPDILPSWSDLENLMNVVFERPIVASQKLYKEVPESSRKNKTQFWEFFHGRCLTKMFSEQKIPGVPHTVSDLDVSSSGLSGLIIDNIRYIYESSGLRKHKIFKMSTAQEAVRQIYEDLGLPSPVFGEQISDEESLPTNYGAVIIRYDNLSPLELMRIENVEGNTYVVVNANYECVKLAFTNENAKRVLESFVSSYALSIQQFPSKRDEMDAVTSYLGIFLKRMALIPR